MSITKIIAVIGVCLLLSGCVPLSGIKELVTLGISVIAAIGAMWGVTHARDEKRIIQKAITLEKQVKAQSHKIHTGNVVAFSTATCTPRQPAKKARAARDKV